MLASEARSSYLSYLSYLCLSLFSCHAASQTSRDLPRVDADAIVEISLERRCFGCPREGKVTLRRDGTATRVVFGNARAGTSDRESTAVLASDAFQELAAAVVSERFFELGDEYRDPAIADGESIVLTVVAGARQKSVLDRNTAAPAPFTRLASRIEKIAAALSWRLTF